MVGKSKMELQKQAVKKGERVVITDDLLATGGTCSAACDLLHQLGAEILECSFIIELKDLEGRKHQPKVTHVFREH